MFHKQQMNISNTSVHYGEIMFFIIIYLYYYEKRNKFCFLVVRMYKKKKETMIFFNVPNSKENSFDFFDFFKIISRLMQI